ncbi:MAG TPA: acylphosphatase [Xanthobacteraceae bacterium]
MGAQVIRRVVVRGLVHGVGYRAFVEDQALLLGLEGWVRNRRDGTVESVIAGAPEAVGEMIEACRRGPFSAQVDGLDVSEAAADVLAHRRRGERFSVLTTI